jgi:aminoglycoside phosphotransferase (APT) family kinase protein
MSHDRQEGYSFEAAVAERATNTAKRRYPDAKVFDVEVLPGGHSGVTLRAMLSSMDAAPQPIVLKATPSGREPVGRHDVLRQARILRALNATKPATPKVLFEEPSAPPFFAMEYVPGESTEPVLDGSAELSHVLRSRALKSAVMLSELHQVRIRDLNLDEPITTIKGELERWTRTMEAIPVELRPRAAELQGLLEKDLPCSSTEASIVHGDFRLGNILSEGSEPRAIVDWEIWSVGDPRIDVGWFLLYADPGNFPGVANHVEGMPDRSELLRQYEEANGSSVDKCTWFECFARYKAAAIMGHNLRRHREGRYHDPYQEQLQPSVLRLVSLGIEILQS